MVDYGLVSVVIPAYNRQKTIEKAVYSVIEQSYKNIEIIIIDDFSIDNTYEIVSRIKDKRIKIYKNDKNRGACFSRNRGINLSKGKYVAFQDSDDIWVSEKIEFCLNELNAHNVDVVFSKFKCGGMYKPNYNLNDFSEPYVELLKHNCVSTQTVLGLKQVFLEIKFDENLPRYQDWDIALRIVQKYRMFYIDRPLVEVYLQSDSISQNFNKGLIALQMIYNKNHETINRDSKIRASFYEFWGVNCEKAGVSGLQYFRIALKSEFSIKKLIRYLLSKYKIYKLWDKLFK